MKTIIIDSDQRKKYCKTLIDEMKADGSNTIEFKKTDKAPTAKQRRLRWLWLTEISQSGLGRNDTKEGADLTAKWQFVRPILLRDNDTFAIIYHHFMEAIEAYSNKEIFIKEFARDYISIEKLMSRKQEAEFLTDLQNYWTRKGVNLTSPALIGLNLDKIKKT